MYHPARWTRWPESRSTARATSSRSSPAPRASARSTSESCATRRGSITLDPGYKNTGSCKSAITFIDGEQGILRYRGYPIEELAEKSNFLEVAYLLIHGELPTAEQYREWANDIRYHTMLHEDLKRFFAAFPKDAHPMAVCSAVISALSTFYPEDLDPLDAKQVAVSDPAADREVPDDRRVREQALDRPARSCTRTTGSATSRTSCA